MEYIYNDIDFISIIEPILENKDFIETQATIHHGITKLDHSIKVAYHSYNIAKKLNLDYTSVARAGILHDFYFSSCEGKSISKDAILLTYKHHNIALYNAEKNFKLNDIEKDIIVKHMFPSVPYTIPKYKESFLVALVDKVIGTHEGLCKIKKLINANVLSKVIPGFILAAGLLK